MANAYDDDLDKQALMAQLGEKTQSGPTGGALDQSGVGKAGDKSVGKVLEGAFAEGGGGRADSVGQPTAKTQPVTEGASGDVSGSAGGAKSDAASGTGGASTYAPSVFQGFSPRHAMEGFDFNREQNTGKSAKDAFAYLANQAPPPPINDKAALAQWAQQYIVPGMNALGHNVSNVQGDKFHLQNWQGDFDVDYGRGAGAEGGALAWQVDDPTAVLSNKAYTPGAGQNAAAQNPALLNAISGGQGGGGEDINAQTKAQIDALINGQTPPMDEKALLEQLQG